MWYLNSLHLTHFHTLYLIIYSLSTLMPYPLPYLTHCHTLPIAIPYPLPYLTHSPMPYPLPCLTPLFHALPTTMPSHNLTTLMPYLLPDFNNHSPFFKYIISNRSPFHSLHPSQLCSLYWSWAWQSPRRRGMELHTVFFP